MWCLVFQQYSLHCVSENKPGVLLEVCPQTQSDVVIFHHSLHVPRLSVRARTGPLPVTERTVNGPPPPKKV